MEENEYAYVDDILPPPASGYPIHDPMRMKDNMVHVDYSSGTEGPTVRHPDHQTGHPNSTMSNRYLPDKPEHVSGSAGGPHQYFVLTPSERDTGYNMNGGHMHQVCDDASLYEHTNHENSHMFAV